MDETTRRELLHRLKIIAAASAIGYVAPKVVTIDAALAGRPPCSQLQKGKKCKKKKKKKKKKRRGKKP